jgi:hypothetical protein
MMSAHFKTRHVTSLVPCMQNTFAILKIALTQNSKKCMAHFLRAFTVHLVLINDKGTDGFLDAFWSFVGR